MTQHTTVKPLPLQILTLVLGIVLFGQILFAQSQTSTAAPDRGFSPGNSYSISDIESIGQQSGNLMFNLPLGSLPASRGGMSSRINLRYDSKLWDLDTYDIERFTTTHDVKTLLKSDEGGWQYGYKYSLKLEYLRLGLGEGYCESGGNNEKMYPYKLQLVMPDGSKHTLRSKDYMDYTGEFMRIFPDGRPACTNGNYPDPVTGTITYFTTDGTFLRVDLTTDSDNDWENNTWTLYSPDGTQVIHNPASGVSQRIKDRNGNFTEIIENTTDSNYSNHRTTYLKDEFGRKVVIEYAAATDEDWIHSVGFNGATLTTKVRWKTIIVNKAYYAGEMAPSPLDPDAYENLAVNQDFRVVEKVILPSQLGSNLDYEFLYNVDATSATDVGWGEVSRVTLPSGAYATYSYFFDNVSGWNSTTQTGIHTEEVLLNRPVQKQLHYDQQYDGSTQAATETWTYTPSITNNNLASMTGVTITSPDGGTTTEQYAEDSVLIIQTPPQNVKGEVYRSTGADGTVTERIYKSNMPMNFPSSTGDYSFLKANRYVKYEFVSITDAAGNPTKTAIKEYSRDKNGNITEIREYDFVAYSSVPRINGLPTGLPSGVTPSRITKTDFYNDTPEASSTTYTDTDSYHLASSPRLLNLAKSAEVQNGAGTPQSRSEISYDYTNYSGSNTKGGNPTQTKVWDSFKGGSSQAYSNPLTSTNSISTSVSYDSYGNPTQTTDAKGVQTTVTYGSINGYTGLYPTQIETASNYSAIKRTSTSAYDFYTGLVTSTTDVDNNLTSGTEYDELGRPVKSKAAVGTALEMWATTEYDDVLRRVISRSDLFVKGDGKKIAVQHFDELGRVRLSRTIENVATEDPYNEQHGIKVQTRYQTGNPYSYQLTSNPYRAATSGAATNEESMGWTRSKTINTGKHSEVETFSGVALPQPFSTSGNTNSTGKVQTDIDADRTLVTDQAGKQRISKTNALGHLTDIWEIVPTSDSSTVSVSFPNQSIAYGYQTSYSYDILNNLTTVNQGSQTRSFSYSSLSRLKSATNPESGLIQYSYDNNGNLTQKTDARNVVTTYIYDALNRLTNRNYSAPTGTPPNYALTPNVTYTYDNLPNAKGKLTKVTNGTSTTEYQVFDIMGRVTQSQQWVDGVSYGVPMEYTYNLSGAMIEQKYPSGRVVKNVLDNDGDLSIVQSKKNQTSGYWDYAKSFTYTASGAVSSMQLGNGKWESTSFNSRLQPTQIALGTVQNGTDKLNLAFNYGTTNNNGNMLSQTIVVPTTGSTAGFTAVQNYTYDSLNRLKSAVENIDGSSTASWKQTFTYDRYGNRRFDEGNTNTIEQNCPTAVCNPTIDPATNKLIGYTFDDAGNTKVDAENRTFTYDAENKQVEVKDSNNNTIGKYFYDGDGKRVKKVEFSANQPVQTTIFIYDSSGRMVAEYATEINTVNPQVSYLTSDHLGSPRITTDKDGNVYSRRDFMPFGEEIKVGTSTQRSVNLNYGEDGLRQKFTSYERDNETHLDFAQARMYSNKLGRFTSADILGGSISEPQTLNRYSYVINNPLLLNDPTGLSPYLDDESAKTKKPNTLNPGNPANNIFQDDDEPLKMPKKTRDKVSGRYETWEKGSLGKQKISAVIIKLYKDVTDYLSTQGDYFFDRGVREAALFQAAINSMKGLIESINSHAALNTELDYTSQVAFLQRQIDTAELGVPISDTNGSGVGAYGVSVSNQRAASDAISAYNSYLAETDAEMKYRGSKFKNRFENEKFRFVYRILNSKRRNGNSFSRMKEKDLRNLFERRMAMARRAGWRYGQ